MRAPDSVCLWCGGPALEVATSMQPPLPTAGCWVLGIQHAPGDYPGGRAGQVLDVRFQAPASPLPGPVWQPGRHPQPGLSLQAASDDRAQTDHPWQALVDNGAQPGACGRGQERWAGPAPPPRAFAAMMTMGRVAIATTAGTMAG